MTDEAPPARRQPAGAAVLREDVTAAIRVAVLQELAVVGFARMSVEGVARRAGVGKTTVYRRWSSKLDLVLDLLTAFGSGPFGAALPPPDTGSLVGDLRALLEVAANALQHPIASQVIPELLLESARNPEIAALLTAVLRDEPRGLAAHVVRQAVDRGDAEAGADPDRLLDLTLAPLYWRLVVLHADLPGTYLDDLATTAARELGSLPRS